MRLWARLALILASVALLSVAVVGGLSSRIASQQAMADSQDDLRREAHLHAEVIGRWLTDQQAHAEAWNQVFVGQVQAMDDTKRSGFLAGVYRGTPAAVVVVMVDGTGQPVVPATYRASADERPAGSPERADALLRRLPIREALQRGSASGTPWIADPAARVPSVPMAVLVANGATAEDALLLGLELQLEGAFDMVERIEPGHGVALFGPSGEPIIGAGQPLLDVDLLQPLLQKDADFRYGTGRDEVMGSMVPVPYTDWSAVVLEPAWQVGATARSIRGSVVGSAVMAVLLATVWAFLAATRISGPVSRLRDAALDLAAGKRTGIETVERSDEIGELGRAFQHMAEQLASQRDAIEQFNRELQDRVDERTRELELAQSALIRSGQLAAVAEVGAGLAHELNNPLSSVLGLAQVLQAQHPDDPVLRDLGGEAERCREVVQALLRFTSGEVDPHDAPVIDLRDALSEVSGLVAGAFRQRGVALELNLQDVPPLLARIDPVAATRMLAQVLNAFRAGLETGATLSLAVADCEADDWVLELSSDQEVAGSVARADDLRASGMELWAAHQQVAQWGGRLEVGGLGTRAGWRLHLPRAVR